MKQLLIVFLLALSVSACSLNGSNGRIIYGCSAADRPIYLIDDDLAAISDELAVDILKHNVAAKAKGCA